MAQKTDKHPLLSRKIRDVLKSRQNVQLNGRSWDIFNALDDLIDYVDNKPFILPRHEEDFTIRIFENLTFPLGNKVNFEVPQRQLLAEYGWPPVGPLHHVNFLFQKLLKELYSERVLPVLLFKNPDMLPETAFRVLQLHSELAIERKRVGVPTIFCRSEYLGQKRLPDSYYAIHIDIAQMVDADDGIEAIEQVCPGQSSLFETDVLQSLIWNYDSIPALQAAAKELMEFASTVGLKEVSGDVYGQWLTECEKREKHAKATH